HLVGSTKVLEPTLKPSAIQSLGNRLKRNIASGGHFNYVGTSRQRASESAVLVFTSSVAKRLQAELRSLLINAARFGRSFSLTALNFNPSPPLGFTCRTTASARICPSWTRKCRLAFVPIR